MNSNKYSTLVNNIASERRILPDFQGQWLHDTNREIISQTLLH